MNRTKKFLLLGQSLAFVFLLSANANAQKTAAFKDAETAYRRGMTFYEQGLYAKAREEFAIVLNQKPNGTSSTAHTQLLSAELYQAISSLRLENPDAEKDLSTFVYRHAPASIASQARLELGRYYFQKKNHDKAIEYLNSIPSGDLNNKELTEVKFQLGYAHFNKKDFKKAMPLFQQIRNIKGDYYEPSNYYYGLCAYYQNDYKTALESFKLVVNSKQHGYSNIVPVYIAQIYFIQKDYKEVISYGQSIYNQSGLKEKEQVAKVVGQSYFELKDYNAALPFLTDYIAKSSKVPQEDIYQLAYTQYRTANYKKAIPNFEQLNALKSELGQNALYNLADCYLKTDNKTAARLAFLKAAEMDFDKNIKEDAFINYAKLSYELGFDTEAIAALQKVNEKSDYYTEAQNLLSNIFINTRDYDNALATIRKITPKTAKLKETHQKIAYFRGTQLIRDKQWAKAITLFDESLTAEGKHQETTALTYFWKADALYQLEKRKEAITAYNEYFKIAPKLKTENIPANSTPEVAHYGLGYAYLKEGNYTKAGESFAQTVSIIKPKRGRITDKYVSDYVYPDALLRSGDCYLYQNKYAKAAEYYKDIIDNNYGNTDYALFQLSHTYHLSSNPQYYEQLAILDRLVKNYPQSLYADDALYSMANTQFQLKSYDLAKANYGRLVEQYPQSEFVEKALLKQGLIAYSNHKNEEALRYYEAVFRRNPQSPEAQDALAFMEEIYVASGNPDGYFSFLSTVAGYSVKEEEKDSVLYVSAERKFRAAEWDAAITGFSTYLNRYPQGNNSLKAHFYRGESLFEQKRYTEAIKDYHKLSELNNITFAETSNLRAASIAYNITQDYSAAFIYYKRLEQYASTEENKYTAQLYGMRSAYWSKQLDKILPSANAVLANNRATQSEKAEANYFLAKMYLQNKEYAKAKPYFQKHIEFGNDDAFSAESHYQLSYITYMERDLAKAKELCFATNKAVPNHIDWIARSFILLADIYAEEGNLFQAKSTLESIVNNYRGDNTILQEAKTKLENVKEAEAKQSKVK